MQTLSPLSRRLGTTLWTTCLLLSDLTVRFTMRAETPYSPWITTETKRIMWGAPSPWRTTSTLCITPRRKGDYHRHFETFAAPPLRRGHSCWTSHRCSPLSVHVCFRFVWISVTYRRDVVSNSQHDEKRLLLSLLLFTTSRNDFSKVFIFLF